MDERPGADGGSAPAPDAAASPSASSLTRRAVLSGSATALATGAAGLAAAQESGMGREPDYGGWFTGDASGGATSSFSGTVDERGSDEVTVEVGANGNGGPFAFAPTAVWVDPGTTVTFEWASDTHNVVVEDRPEGADWSGHEPIENTGFSFSHTFEAGGVYTYYCDPHLPLGMKGAIAVGDDVPTAAGGDGGGGFTLPGGDSGASFMGLLLGTAGVAAALVLAGDLHGAVTRDADGPTSAHTTALTALGLGLVLIVAVVVRLALA